MVDTPFPAQGTITPTNYGYSANLPCASEWLTQTETGDYLQQAVDRAARKHGEGTEVEVRFTSNDGLQCTGFTLLGAVEDND
jgi:hypothetical protein